jgi:hypothetical protein
MARKQDFQVRVVRRFVPDTPERIRQRRDRVIAILRRYRAYLFTPENLSEEQRAEIRKRLEADDD